MELNRETVEKALDWLDSLVDNSNYSEMAMRTYQLLGILYNTCEDLTHERTRHLSQIDAKDVIINDLNEKHNRLLEENERLRAKYEITYETPSGKMAMPNLLSLDGKAAELHTQIEHKVKADTVTEVVAGIMGIIEFDIALTEDETEYLKHRIDEYANEMLEDSK